MGKERRSKTWCELKTIWLPPFAKCQGTFLSKRIEDIVAMEENINSNKVGKLPRLPAGICATVCAGRKKREKKKNAFLPSIFLLLCYFMHNWKRAGHAFARVNGQNTDRFSRFCLYFFLPPFLFFYVNKRNTGDIKSENFSGLDPWRLWIMTDVIPS